MPVLIDEELLGSLDVCSTDTPEDGEEFPLPPTKRQKPESTSLQDDCTIKAEEKPVDCTELTQVGVQDDISRTEASAGNSGPSDRASDGQNSGRLTEEEDDSSQNDRLLSGRTKVAKVEVRPSQLTYPASLYEGWNPPLPRVSEKAALFDLLQEHRRLIVGDDHPEDIIFTLSNFTIYRAPASKDGTRKHAYEMEALHYLREPDCDEFLFDGVISFGNIQRYVQAIRFGRLSIAGYGDKSVHSVDEKTWIQSAQAEAHNAWYLLKEPSAAYKPYHEAFLWVADLTRHVVDFMETHDKVTLHHFKAEFNTWLQQRHGGETSFDSWRLQLPGSDFRKAVIAHVKFIWKEVYGVAGGCASHPFWADVNFPPSGEKKDKDPQKTVVTPYVFENFKDMAFSHLLRVNQASPEVTARIESRKARLSFIDASEAEKFTRGRTTLPTKGQIKKGDFVVLKADEETIWRDGSYLWYAFIQEVREDRHGETYDIIWLYSPSSTTLSTGKYPYANEIFWSDHCNCNEVPIRAEDVIGKVSIKWLRAQADLDNLARGEYDFFVRQKYDTDGHFFSTLTEGDFFCPCKKHSSDFDEIIGKFSIGDTVLVPFTQHGKPSRSRPGDYTFSNVLHETLEPVVIEKFFAKSETLLVRRLLSRKAYSNASQARPNELVWSEELYEIPAWTVGPKCYARFADEDDVTAGKLQTPYDRNGKGNCWVITTRSSDKKTLEKLQRPYPSSLNQGFDLAEPPPRPQMKGLDLYSGGGNFGRGLAEGGAVDFLYAVDWNKNAVLTYKANEKRHSWVYWGSVNDYFSEVLQGTKGTIYASIGEIDFIAAGSPCQGFSNLQPDLQSESSLRNASMITSVAAYIDIYRPKYAILENVVAMTFKGKGRMNIFEQLLCTLVGMGYQVSQHRLDAWSFGEPQQRSRLFIAISAPGLVPMPPPTATHSHPPNTKSASLGQNAAKVKFGLRAVVPTPFRYISVKDAMGDLPDIREGRTRTCISHPDHRTTKVENIYKRTMIRHIPIYPPGKSVIEAIRDGAIPDTIAKTYLSGRKKRHVGEKNMSWSRVIADRLTPTITTVPGPDDRYNGRILHWQQHRVLTVLEARRAQGFPDNEVIIGTLAEQWKIVGNSVSRSVALGLGLSIREAWLSNPPDQPARAPRGSLQPSPSSDELTNMMLDNINVTRALSPDELELPPPAPTPAKSLVIVQSKQSLSARSSSSSYETRAARHEQERVEISTKTTVQRTATAPSLNGNTHTNGVVSVPASSPPATVPAKRKATALSRPSRQSGSINLTAHSFDHASTQQVEPRRREIIDLTADDSLSDNRNRAAVVVVSRTPDKRTRRTGDSPLATPTDWSKSPGRRYVSKRGL